MKRSSQFSGIHAIATLTLVLLSLSESTAAVFTNDTTIAPSNTAYEGADIVVSNATLTVDGPHTFVNLLIGPGGIVTHSFSSSGTITTNIPVLDEPQILAGTNEVTLANQNIAAGTVTVKDMSGTISYQINSDFIVSVGGLDTFLRRNEPSSIPDGSMVLVSYEIPGGTISAGLSLTVTGNVEVAAGGFINANGRGFGGNLGTGNGGETGSTLTGAGAGHGGYGGLSTSNAPGGNVYGAFDQPITLGSGGGQGVGGVGGNGGGAIRLIVSGMLKVDGAISVNGLNATNGRSGGGSGGSIWINAQSVSGAGAITAHGGNGEPIHGGGGGGGRIAIYGTNNLSGSLAAYGGLGWKAGGAGTIYAKPTGTGLLLVDNGGRVGTNTVTTLSGGPDVIIRGGAVVVPSGFWTARDVLVASNSFFGVTAPNSAPVNLTARSLVVEPTAAVIADGTSSGTSGSSAGGAYAGGAHGGGGGNSTTNSTLGGIPFGDQVNPATSGGSGGGTNISVNTGGGAGGSVIRLNVSVNIVLNGRISSSGRDGSPAGGGAGGSIWISTGTFSGTGTIVANGGNGHATLGGGGGGGRIALYVTTTNQFTGAITAYGGGGANRGGAGTIFFQIMGAAGPLSQEFILDNGGFTAPNARTNTLISSFSSAPVLTVRNGAAGQIASVMTLPSVFVKSNSSLVSPYQLTVTSNVVVESTAAIHADGVGANFSTSGVGTQVSQGIYFSGGGGHGGYGGLGAISTARGGNISDSVTSPTGAGGQGGGSGTSQLPFGGAGGGALRMTVNGSLTNNGRISSDGKIGSGTYAGGGAGGSVWLTIGKFYGAGSISVNGGPGIMPGGGGGGGGRISVGCTSNFFGGIITAYGGSGTNYGGAGTIYLSTNQFVGGLFVDNGGNAGTNTVMMETSFNWDITVSGRGALIISLFGNGPRNVLVKTNGTLLMSVSQSQQTLNLSGNMTIDAGGLFSLEGRGNAAGSGSGSGNTSGNPKGGAGHGGYGALNINSFGNAYGSITSPSFAGSGGGSGSGTSLSPLGGAGGGALRLQFTGNNPVLTVNGRLSANGLPGELNSGGGSGGSLWLTPATLAGNGVISANGGAGNGTAGGGGGGRIAVSYNSNLFTGQLTAFGGSGAVAGGAGTIYTKLNSASVGPLLIDNGSRIGTNTPLSSAFSLPTSPFNLTISGGASVFALTQLPQLSNLVINASSTLTMSSSTTNVFLNVLRNATIAAGGAINVDGKGYARSLGTSPGASALNKGAGGGHGGAGGNSQSGALGGTNYGSITQPMLRGSGGGAGANTYVSGCEGGGGIRITAGGTLNVDGYLGANGNPGIQDDSGGGSGGSIWITAGGLIGAGNILAEGGDGDLFGGGGGAGGRIAIYSPTNNFAGLLSVDGGIGYADGQDGSIFITTNLSLVEIISGRVTNVFGQGVTGASVVFLSPQNGISVTSITDSNGNYSVVVPSSLGGTLTPSLGTNVFFPGLLNFNTITTSFTGQNFLMVETIIPTLAMQKVGTNLILNWNGLPTIVYWIERSTNLVDWMNFSGNFYGAGSHQVIAPIDTEPAVFFRVRGFY